MTGYSWINGVSGDWSTSMDWSGGVPNSSTVSVTIAAIGTYVVDIAAAESFAAGSINLNDASATLRIDGTLNLARTLTLNAGTFDLDGTVNGGTINTRSGIFTVAQGVLNGVTCQGEIRLTGPSSSLAVTGGISMSGTSGAGSGMILLTGAGSSLNFDGSQTLNDATIDFGGNSATGYATLDVSDSGPAATLTLGAKLNIAGSSRFAQIVGGSSDAGVVNDGAISATAKGGQFDIDVAFTNNGGVSVANGDTLMIAEASFANAAGATLTAATGGTLDVGYSGGSWGNAGTITATGATIDFNGVWTNTGTLDVTDSTVILGASLPGATLTQFAGQGNSIVVSGSVANTGSTLAVGAGTGLGAVALDGGTITGGTIADAGGGLSFNQATLDAVTYEGALELGAPSSSLTVDGGITLTGTGGVGAGTVKLTGNSGALVFAGDQTLNNATITIGSAASSGHAALEVSDAGSPAVLVLGRNLDIAGSGLYATLGSNSPDATIFNDGAISATAAGGQFDVGQGALALVNYGGLSVSNGDALAIDASTFANAAGATITAATGSTLNLGLYAGSWVNSGAISATGDTVDFAGDWTNAGTIDVANSAVTLGGNSGGVSLTVAQLNLFAGKGNAITLGGTLDNAGNVLSVGAGTGLGAIALDGGTITGGTIADSGGGLSFTDATLNGVTYQGAIDLGAADSQLTVDNGIAVTGAGGAGAGTINLTGADSVMAFVGSQTLDNATVNLAGKGASLKALSTGAPMTLIFGKNLNIVVSGSGHSIYIPSAAHNTTIVNNGAISVAGGHLSIGGGGGFTNYGSLTALYQTTIAVDSANFTNISGTTLTGGTYEADAKSTINLGRTAKIVTDDAKIILSGERSVVESDGSAIDSTLTTIGATGVLELLGGRSWNVTPGFTDGGALVLDGGAVGGGSLALAVSAGGSLAGSGVVEITVANSGLIEASGGALTLVGAVTGTGALKIDAGATLTLGGALAAGGTATFNGASADLAIAAVSGFGDTIAGLAATDEIDLVKTAATSAVVNGSNQLVVTNNGAAVATFNLSGSAAGLAFTTESDTNGGTFIVAGAAPAPHASLHLFRQYVAAGFGDHAAPLMDRQDHLAMAQPHHDFAAGRV
jgi:hypothetical protein